MNRQEIEEKVREFLIDDLEIDEEKIKIKDFSSKGFSVSVDWGTALQALFAIIYLGGNYKQKYIASLIGVDVKTVGRAVKMINKDFEGLYYDVVCKKKGKKFNNQGSHFEIGALDLERR